MKSFFKNKRLFGLSVSTSNAPTTPEPTTTAVPTTTPEPTTTTTTPPPCSQEFIDELKKDIADYATKIEKAKKRQAELVDIIEQAKIDKNRFEKLEKQEKANADQANEWYQYYTDFQNSIKEATFGLGCWSLKDSYENASTGNDAVDTALEETITRIIEKAAKAAAKLEAEQLLKYGVGAGAAAAITSIGTLGAVGLGLLGGATGFMDFCLGLDIGRGFCYLEATHAESMEAHWGKLKLDAAFELRNRQIEMENLRENIGEWFRLKNYAFDQYLECLKNAPIFKLQALSCKTIKENLKISRNKIKKFHSKKIRLESENNTRSDKKNIYKERIPFYKFEIKKLKNYRDRYYSDDKASFAYVAFQNQIKAYEKMILFYQKLSKKINYQNLKYGKELEAVNEKYILEQQNYKDITKQLVKNCTV